VTYTYGGSSCLSGASPCYNVARRTGMTDAGGSESFSYDALGHEFTEQRTTNGHSKTTSYAYNLDGSMASLTYPSGRTITYTINAAGDAVSAVDTANSVNYATSASYGPTSALASVDNGTNLASVFFYNNRLQPCRMAEMAGSGAMSASCTDTNLGNILDLTYNFSLGSGDNGNVVGIANNQSGESGRSQAFAYDTLNRIIAAGTTATTGSYCWGEVYSYDAWANLTTIGAQAGYSGCTQESGMSVSMVTGTNQISSFGYDAAGNTTSDGTYSYAWNAESEMSSAASTNYTYDGDGNRVEKSGGKLYWYGAGTEILDESDTSGSITEEYVFFGGKRIAMRDISSGNIYYYAGDLLGSTSKMVQDGHTSACFDVDYYPFGGERDITTSCNPVYKFEGKERDAETQNDDFGARYYSWRFGRWLSSDWSTVPVAVPYATLSNPQTLNLYAMVADNPETDADLDGHYWDICHNAYDCSGVVNSSAGSSSDPEDAANLEASPQQQSTKQEEKKAQQQSSSTTSNSTAPSDPIATGLSNVPGVASVTPAPDPTRDKAIGGHQNETDALTFKTPEDQAKFLAESSRKHLVPGDVSENGFGPGVRLPGGLHAEQGRVDPVSGQFLVTAHIDRFNANNGLAPLVGHFVVDVMIGMTFFHHSAGLDH
jgi:RHS repeat-associated protein